MFFRTNARTRGLISFVLAVAYLGWLVPTLLLVFLDGCKLNCNSTSCWLVSFLFGDIHVVRLIFICEDR